MCRKSLLSPLILLVISFLLAGLEAVNKDALPTKPIWNVTWTDKLKRDLLHSYDKFARPAQHTNITVVKVHMTFHHFDLDELKGVMTVHGWVRMLWNDEKLRWNASDYGGLNVLHVADHEIWQPDIVLYNSATGSSIDHYGNTHCLIYANGDVLWVPPAQFLVFCELDLRLWPFDSQFCYMMIGSWTYAGDQIDLQLYNNGSDVELFASNSEWALDKIVAEREDKFYTCCSESYPDIRYNITLKRRSPTYKAIVITPATVIVLMTLVNFWLPPHAGEKIILNGCTAIIICIFFMYFSQKLPAMASHTPLVVLFYSSSLYLVCLSLVISVIVMNISRNRHSTHLPWIVKSVLTGLPGRLLGLQHFIAQTQVVHQNMAMSHSEELRDQQQPVIFEDHNDDHQMIPREGKIDPHSDWILLAAAIDRIMFLIYCFLFIILAIAYSI